VARIGWFLAGAATAAAALVAAPHSYNRLRSLVDTSGEAMAPAADETDTGPGDFAPASAFASYDAPAEAARVDEDTAELRLRIDETRQRIRRRAEDGVPADDDAGDD
jgi:gas vesicle protein